MILIVWYSYKTIVDFHCLIIEVFYMNWNSNNIIVCCHLSERGTSNSQVIKCVTIINSWIFLLDSLAAVLFDQFAYSNLLTFSLGELIMNYLQVMFSVPARVGIRRYAVNWYRPIWTRRDAPDVFKLLYKVYAKIMEIWYLIFAALQIISLCGSTMRHLNWCIVDPVFTFPFQTSHWYIMFRELCGSHSSFNDI